MLESLFNKVAGLRPATLLKRDFNICVFSCEMCEIFKNTFLKRTPPVALLYGRLLLTGAKAKKITTKYLTQIQNI